VQISSFPKISSHELIDHTVWPLEGVKFPGCTRDLITKSKNAFRGIVRQFEPFQRVLHAKRHCGVEKKRQKIIDGLPLALISPKKLGGSV